MLIFLIYSNCGGAAHLRFTISSEDNSHLQQLLKTIKKTTQKNLAWFFLQVRHKVKFNLLNLAVTNSILPFNF